MRLCQPLHCSALGPALFTVAHRIPSLSQARSSTSFRLRVSLPAFSNSLWRQHETTSEAFHITLAGQLPQSGAVLTPTVLRVLEGSVFRNVCLEFAKLAAAAAAVAAPNLPVKLTTCRSLDTEALEMKSSGRSGHMTAVTTLDTAPWRGSWTCGPGAQSESKQLGCGMWALWPCPGGT